MKIKIITFVAMLVFVFVTYRFYTKYTIDTSLRSVVWNDLNNAFDDYSNVANPTEIDDKGLFIDFLSDKKKYTDLVENLGYVDFRMIYINNELFIYSIGYDQNNDFASKFYIPNKVGYLRSLFIDGDIILLKKDMVLSPVDDEESAIPPPPPFPPDTVTD